MSERLRACLILNACQTDFPWYGPIILVTVGINHAHASSISVLDPSLFKLVFELLYFLGQISHLAGIFAAFPRAYLQDWRA